VASEKFSIAQTAKLDTHPHREQPLLLHLQRLSPTVPEEKETLSRLLMDLYPSETISQLPGFASPYTPEEEEARERVKAGMLSFTVCVALSLILSFEELDAVGFDVMVGEPMGEPTTRPADWQTHYGVVGVEENASSNVVQHVPEGTLPTADDDSHPGKYLSS
jgi:hypothetical protein